MKDKNIEHILVKYLSKSANAAELDFLEGWLQKDGNFEVFQKYVKTDFELNYAMAEQDERKIKERLLSEIRSDKRKLHRKRTASTLGYAVLIGLLVAGGYILFNRYEGGESDSPENPPSNSITLQLNNGDLKVLEETGNVAITDRRGRLLGNQEGKKLKYVQKSSSEALVFNTLTVPYGKRFDLELSDGTEVYLNAGTVLRYPINFIKGKKRQVYLTGEAYFEVTENDKDPFIVTADDMDVQVIGTEFNVSSYPEDETKDVVLVSGSVALSASRAESDDPSREGLSLEPGQKGSLTKSEGTFTTKSVMTDIYTSWKEGKLIFRQMSFANILKKLERHYNISIVNRNKKLANEKFNANFGDEPLETVLGYFEKTYSIEYTIQRNRVIIE